MRPSQDHRVQYRLNGAFPTLPLLPVGRIEATIKIEALVADNGGTFSKTVDSTTHLVSTEADVKKNSAKVKAANNAGTPIVTLEWLLDSIEGGKKEDETSYLLSSGPPPPPAPSTRPKRKAAAPAVATADDADSDEPPAKKVKTTAAPKGNAKGKAKPRSKAKVVSEDEEMEDVEDEEEEEKEPTPPPPKMKTVIRKGKAPVDELCPLAGSHHVYVDETGVAWDATLNQTDIGRNNNKFYYCQLLERDNSPMTYAVFCRWGRVGDRGQSKMYAESVSLPAAKSVFDKQMKAKTGKSWAQRKEALGGNKKYAYLERNYDDDDDDEEEETTPTSNKPGAEDSKPPPKPTIAPELVRLMELIFNSSFMQQTMASMSYDSNKLPLGKLSKDTILRGFNLLKQIGEVIGDPANAVQNFSEYGNSYQQILSQLSSRYYTVIPHNFGRSVPPVIGDQSMLKREAELVENLIDMKISTEIMTASVKDSDVHPVDKQFASLGLNEAIPLDKTSSEYKYLEAYVKKTQGHTHYMKLQVEEIFRIRRDSEEARWKEKKWHEYENDNRMLLWHGSRTTNFSGILSQGLRIAPPEAPVSGYMFDKGIYLADIVSKSANYCYPQISANTGLLLLCEAQLGDPMYESKGADYYAATNSKKSGAIATKGLGRTVPLEWEDASIIHEDLEGVQIPKVSSKKDNITGNSSDSGLYLQYNEF
ncbi:poly(ADP)-ribose polymerase [Coprinopsis cinerea okayama7|uniref:Poly [ADP-ribose] polymerase n=1 Tax=Coprinopsis cinerea (strain Okayama-7 / 130 / ATCC MYA-4618 / FGSC 9003) TaxID=240176 RepID=A8NF82_COPC7|nr:poly(ADP)-ribose polymerase [Coprinopsis cinerea okayama7\|eukprot:XP_001833221.2 poly(ADP)-ribose polymerase [Coprinopsis cinerea okayama7\